MNDNGDIRPFYGVVIDDSLDGVGQHLRAVEAAAHAEQAQREKEAETDPELQAALGRLRATIEALEAHGH